MSDVDIRALAKLARLEVSADEVERLEKEIPQILSLVDTIQKANVGNETKAPNLRNVLRADEHPIETGSFTEKLLDAAPSREGNRIAVKQVISRKK